MIFEVIYFDGGFGVVKDGKKIFVQDDDYCIETTDGEVLRFPKALVKVIRPLDEI